MSTQALVDRAPVRTAGPGRQGFGHTLRAEWITFWSVRSAVWSTVLLFVLGVILLVGFLVFRRRDA
jgi:ABC-2 type transport system permease protein